ncbi:MAG: DinB family protein [Betaproteobacteria bacterium]|nr:MAG: DinB family protein [Betaproteobacteria bacterium]
MITTEYVSKMASYNQWMNDKLYAAARRLPPDALIVDRNAFFASIIGTLNHIVVGDTLWLKRFAAHPAPFESLNAIRGLDRPETLDQILFADLQELSANRTMIDSVILRWAEELTEADLQQAISYSNMKGVGARKTLAALLVHFFNHQTHHRGQATTLLTQAGQDVGVTDVLALMSDIEEPDA